MAKTKKNNILTKILIFIVVFVILPIICLIVFWFHMNSKLEEKSSITKNITFEIKRGESINSVGKRLERSNLIPSFFFYKLYIKSKHYTSLQAGEFSIPATSSTKDIISIFRYSKPTTHFFKVIEGTTVSVVLRNIKNASYLTGSTPTTWQEGYLLPDTWSTPKGTKRIALLNRMRRALVNVLDKEWKNRADNTAVETKEQALILASIIEKETSIKSERFKVSAVYSNRLRLHMKLQADPTTIYGITKGDYKLTRSLKHKDLLEKNDYNTYMIAGLPKTPIAIVSKESINAALHPAKVDYLYFVATGHGGSIFANNYKDHERNIKNWLKVLKTQRSED